MVKIPNLTFDNALRFVTELNNLELKEGEEFDFENVYKCDPFPMLLVSTGIRQLRERSDVKKCKAINCKNTYAKHMRFYKAIGIDYGRDLSENYGNGDYLPITKLEIDDLRSEGIENSERIQEVIEKKAKLMANVLSKGNTSFKNWLKYILTEIMRNIPEHSKASAIWYCAQYWPSYDLVELAILDEGIGIKNSLTDSPVYSEKIKDDESAILLALQPGISKAFAQGSSMISNDLWANSGFGLYMVSRLCSNLGGSFIISSGNSAIMVNDDEKITRYDTAFKGTAIQIRIQPSKINNYEEIAKEILQKGEYMARTNKNSYKSASKSSKKIFWE